MSVGHYFMSVVIFGLYIPDVGCDILDFFCVEYTATTGIYTLSLHDALPILIACRY